MISRFIALLYSSYTNGKKLVSAMQDERLKCKGIRAYESNRNSPEQ